MSKLYPKSGHIYLDNGAYRVWSSDGRPVNLLPLTSRISRSLTVSFPDFEKRRAYAYSLHTDPFSGFTYDACSSWVTILPENWSSGSTVLAALPAGCNYVDVRVTINRTKNPTNRLSYATPNLVPTQQTWLPGGSCFCEFTAIWKRAFHIVISGSNIVLWRQQTVFDGTNSIPWNPGNATTFPNGGQRQGWTYSGGSNADKGHLAQIIQGKGTSSPFGKNRGQSNACSLADNTDFSSIWTGTVQLWPGYIAA